MSAPSTVRRQWVALLAKMIAPADPEPAGRALASLLPFLSGYPDAAFTLESARAVARGQRYSAIPDYGVVDRELGVWWRDNRPHVPALPAPQPVSDWRPPTEAERVAVALRLRQFRDTVEAERVPDTTAPVQPRHLSPNDLAAVYRHEAENNPDARLRACAATRLAMLSPARAVTAI